jgi:hypothetical protein
MRTTTTMMMTRTWTWTWTWTWTTTTTMPLTVLVRNSIAILKLLGAMLNVDVAKSHQYYTTGKENSIGPEFKLLFSDGSMAEKGLCLWCRVIFLFQNTKQERNIERNIDRNIETSSKET